MPRLFLGNFDFEHSLANPGRQLPAKLKRLNAELATSWLALAEDGDYLWTPEPIEARFFENAVKDGLPRVHPVTSFDSVPAATECIPWGWTNDVRQLCDGHRWRRNDPPDKAVRAANSRRLSAALEREWRLGLDFAGEATEVSQIERFVEFHGLESRWVIKAEFGMSGRERLIGSGMPTADDRNWLKKRFHANRVVFFEPWVENLGEVGIQLEVPRSGEPRCIDVVPMNADQRGQYCGSQLLSEVAKHSQVMLRSSDWGLAMDMALQAARRVQDLGYFGPLGIDAMQYRDANGQIRIRPLQDINARWTMGRLCLGFRRMLEKRESAIWLHGPPTPPADFDVQVARMLKLARDIELSKSEESESRVFQQTQPFSMTEIFWAFEHSRISHAEFLQIVTLLEGAGLIRAFSGTQGEQPRSIPTSPPQVGGQPCAHRSLLQIN